MEWMFFVWSTILEKEGGWKKSAWTAEPKLCLPNLLSSQGEMDGSVGKGRVGVRQVRISGSEVQRAVLAGCALPGGC